LPQRLQAPAPDRDKFTPVFVLATARSYSSVVTAMIGQNPQLVGLPELKLFSYRTVGELEASLPATWRGRGVTHRSPGLVRAVAEFLFGDQSAGSVTSARAWLKERVHWSGADVLDVLQAHIWPRAAVEKSPENVATPAAFRRLSAAYPRARYVHLTRHPASTLCSMLKHWRRTMREEPPEGLQVMCVASWLDINRRILRYGASLHGDRYLRIRAEDILNDPVAQLRLIARTMGVRADDDAVAAMSHPESSPFARFGPRCTGVTGGSDPGFLRSPMPRRAMLPHSLDQPAAWTGDPGLWLSAARLAAELGYG
jgi:Sulfotransferase family